MKIPDPPTSPPLKSLKGLCGSPMLWSQSHWSFLVCFVALAFSSSVSFCPDCSSLVVDSENKTECVVFWRKCFPHETIWIWNQYDIKREQRESNWEWDGEGGGAGRRREWGRESRRMSYIIHFTTAATNKQGCTSTLDIGHRPQEFAKCLFDFSVERTNVPLLSCQCGHCLGFFLCACDSWTLHSRFCDWLVAHSPSLHMTIKHSHSHLFLYSLTQHWPLSACSLLCHIS